MNAREKVLEADEPVLDDASTRSPRPNRLRTTADSLTSRLACVNLGADRRAHAVPAALLHLHLHVGDVGRRGGIGVGISCGQRRC